jgi:hypothetical protein
MRSLAFLVLLLLSLGVSARGLNFAEEMHGYAYWNSEFRPTSVYLKVVIDDIDAWRASSSHAAKVTGSLVLDHVSVKPITGQLSILTTVPGVQGRLLVYSLSGYGFRYFGVKHVRDDRGLDLVDDMTTLRGVLRASTETVPTVSELLFQARWSSELRFEWWRASVLWDFLMSFDVTNAWWWEEPAVELLFAQTVLGGLAHEFFPWLF